MNLLSLAKESAKQIFKFIRNVDGFNCEALSSKVFITRKFLQHICYNHKKDREFSEIMERILIMPFVHKILEEGIVVDSRKKYGITFYRITYLQGNKFPLTVIIEKKEEQKYVLLSCFQDEKRLVSGPPYATSSPYR